MNQEEMMPSIIWIIARHRGICDSQTCISEWKKKHWVSLTNHEKNGTVLDGEPIWRNNLRQSVRKMRSINYPYQFLKVRGKQQRDGLWEFNMRPDFWEDLYRLCKSLEENGKTRFLP